MYATYRRSCPSCGGDVEDVNLSKGIPCNKCLKKAGLEVLLERPELRFRKEVRRKLAELGGPLGKALKLEEELEELEALFREVAGSVLWSAQRAWALRALRGESFSIVAPTGMGKSTFGALVSVFLAKRRGKKSYIIVPTTPLVTMMARRASSFASSLGVEVVYVHSKLSPSVRKEMMEKLRSGNFDVLITTSRFLINNLELLKNFDFGFVFVDDVDSVLKSPRNVDRILMLLGLSQEDVSELERIDREYTRKMSLLTKTQDLQKRYQLLKEIDELLKELERIRKKVRGNVVVSSATGKARGRRVRLFTRLLGFAPGGAGEGLRNVVDSYTYEDYLEIVKKLGKGGLVFVPADLGVEGAEEVAKRLREAGVKAEAVSSEKAKAIDEFAEGKLDVLVGVATHYGVLVRGIDLPHVIRYAVFVGVPRFKFKLKLEEPSPLSLYRLASLAAKFYDDVARLYSKLRKWVQRLSPQQLKEIEEKLKEGKVESPAEKDFYEAYLKLKELVNKEEFLKKLEEGGDVVLLKEGDSLFVLVPDAASYLQASGRTSRLYAGGVTKGLSVVIVDHEPLFKGLKKRLRWVIEEWKRFEELNLDELLKEIDEDREKVLKVMRGELKAEEIKRLLKTVLLIVESPNKARTITSFFGRPSTRQVRGVKVYEVSLGDKLLYVAASGGHVYDLVGDSDPECLDGEPCTFFGIRVNGVPEEVLTSIKKCSVCGHQFSEDVGFCPRCGSGFLKDSREVVEGLRLLAQEVDEVLIGTDPDTEGEKIGWDVKNLIAPFAKEIKRAEFHEVTKKAILEALENPREFDMGYVWSQMVRRAEDRLTGFTLSPKLWFDLWPSLCKIAEELKRSLAGCPVTRNLSAGRVQTPVLGWVIERYEEHKKSRKKFYIIKFEGVEIEFSEDELTVEPSPAKLAVHGEVEVEKLSEAIETLKPLPPYTTDTMLEDANSVLRLDASTTMKLAQDLFEMGFITYHRTDSTRVSDAGIAIAREWISERFGEGEFVPRRWGEGGAHEAIRPTRPLSAEELKRLIEDGLITPPKALTARHFALYDLIFRRFMASQMKEAKVKKALYRVKLVVEGVEAARKDLESVVEVVEEGFLKLYSLVRVEALPEGRFPVKEARGVVRHTVPLYSQADLIRMMKERGLGRPSTYAKIVSTLIERRYVTLSKVGKKLVPTARGFAVYAYLTGKVYGSGWTARALSVIIKPEGKKSSYFSKFVSEEATRRLEEIMDEIAEKKDEKLYLETVKRIIEESKVIPLLGEKSPFA